MNTRELTLVEIGLIAGTRGMLGAGIGLLLAGSLTNEQRRAVGCTLLMVGVVSTIPLINLIGRAEKQKLRADQNASESLAKSAVKGLSRALANQ